jgi:hypothetical protein
MLYLIRGENEVFINKEGYLYDLSAKVAITPVFHLHNREIYQEAGKFVSSRCLSSHRLADVRINSLILRSNLQN